MTSKFLVILCVLVPAMARLSAQSVTIEPSRTSAYSEDRPAFMFFKKIVISPRSSGSYDVEITLQDALPNTFPNGRGASFSMEFDFAEIAPEKSLSENRIPNFHADLDISLNRGIGKTRFEAWPASVDYRKRNWEVKVTNLIARKDTISFSLRSPLFALHPPSLVLFRSNYWRSTSPTQSFGALIDETTPVSPDPSSSDSLIPVPTAQ
ncbi:MAG TPA: hypothetical protein PLS03_10755 [Terrimicrobiaceae bacterium]|mgnify:CR=1 FL=1|nr:hypothetical protein [Terrimicrobiaceae bacterium]